VEWLHIILSCNITHAACHTWLFEVVAGADLIQGSSSFDCEAAPGETAFLAKIVICFFGWVGCAASLPAEELGRITADLGPWELSGSHICGVVTGEVRGWNDGADGLRFRSFFALAVWPKCERSACKEPSVII
jgi:hypothetical protein